MNLKKKKKKGIQTLELAFFGFFRRVTWDELN